jgi:hypothetical protein
LKVRFDDGSSKLYDCEPLLEDPRFEQLKDPVFFRLANNSRDPYGVVWDDETDLAESEIWLNGTPC